MSNSFTAPTTYFLQEGRENLSECLKVAFQAAVQHDIEKIIIFTAFGEGIRLAVQTYCDQEEYARIKLVAVTFPADKGFTNANKEPIQVELADDVKEIVKSRQIPVVRAHLPFDPIEPGAAFKTRVGAGLDLLGETLNMFCGSMSLCVGAVALACDGGHVDSREHVISLTSDTAILAQAAVTRKMLSQLIIREILCKPAILTIGRSEVRQEVLEGVEGEAAAIEAESGKDVQPKALEGTTDGGKEPTTEEES